MTSAADLLWLSWQRAWAGCGAASSGADIYQALLIRYQEPQRHYHTLQHLTECLQGFAVVADLPGSAPEHPAEVELALWFHDAIYDIKPSDNEGRSADWARQVLVQHGAADAVAERVHALILATRHTAQPVAGDAQILVDIDLAILGAAAPRFAEYEQQIRREYADVPGWLFRQKRRAILRGFLQRPHIYSTPYFRTALEETARANLQRAIDD